MGRSAKLHKRMHKKVKSNPTSGNTATTATSSSSSHTQAQAAQKRANLKNKAARSNDTGDSEKGVLGGADYVSLLMGGRRKAREEAKKLPGA